uniref:Uncharacterized protein n=1 Tax=Aegilops tauschii subsp. strangulata TaxID=200361 RepID=A0A453EQ80_AEGTS
GSSLLQFVCSLHSSRLRPHTWLLLLSGEASRNTISDPSAQPGLPAGGGRHGVLFRAASLAVARREGCWRPGSGLGPRRSPRAPWLPQRPRRRGPACSSRRLLPVSQSGPAPG